MGKILDTITVFFKGNTDDLKKKKKEAEDLSSEAAKNLKGITTETNASNAALDTTNKYLATTESITYSIGKDIASWGAAAKESSEQINEALSSDKAKHEDERRLKAITATKKGVNEVEKAFKGVVSQIASAALGALSISKVYGAFKDVGVSNLNLAQASRNFNLPIREIYAYGQATKEVGGNVNDYISTLDALRRGYQKSGPALKEFHDELLAQGIAFEKALPTSGRNFLESFGFSPGEIDTAFATPKILDTVKAIAAQGDAIEADKDKVLELHTAWNAVGQSASRTATDLENDWFPRLTKILDFTKQIIDGFNEGKSLFSVRLVKHGHTVGDYPQDPDLNKEFETAVTPKLLQLLQSPYDARHYGLAAGSGTNPAVRTDFTVNVGGITVDGSNITDSKTFSSEAVGAMQLQIDSLLQYYNDSRIA